MSMKTELTERIADYHENVPLIPVVDAHLHLVTFLQTSDGMQALVNAMDAGNIVGCVVFGLPVKKKWEYVEPHKPSYYLDDDSRCIHWSATDEIVASGYLNLSLEERKRLAPCLCGFDPTDLACVDYIEYMFEKYPFWRGIGEILCRHDDLTHLTPGETARANHPALQEVYRFCAREKIPVTLHQNSTSVGIHDEYIFLHEMREVLDRHPDTTFVWCHCGCSRRVTHPEYFRMVGGLLNEYPHLYVDFSWVVYEDIICKPRKGRSERLVPKKQWLHEVVLPYAERIILGSDLCGKFQRHGQTMARFNGLFEVLPPDVAQKVARLNAEQLWFS